jgi:hypothetical protein
MNREATMKPVEISITVLSDSLLSVSVDYKTGGAAVKSWRADRAVIDGLCDNLDQLLRECAEDVFSDSERDDRRREILKRATSIGLALYQEVMQEEGDALRTIMDAPEEDRYLTFKIERTLAYIPFELMYDGHGFLSHSAAIGRIVVTEEVELRVSPPAEGALPVLIVGDPSDDAEIRDDIEHEIAVIRDVFSREKAYSLKIASGPEVDKGFLLSNLPGAAVFHFTGHGVVGEEPGTTGIKLAEGRVLGGDSLRGIQNPPGVVFLNMCTAAPRTAWRGSLGIVETLLGRGVRACVASLWDVGSKSATELASRFYTYLTRGDTLGHALRKARADTARATGLHNLTWAAYALYGDPSAALTPERRVPGAMRTAARLLALAVIGVFLLVFFIFPAAIQKERHGRGLGVNVGYLLVESQPADANILVDGAAIARTPVTIEMPAGRYHLIVEKQGYKRWEAWVEVRESARTDIRADLMKIR